MDCKGNMTKKIPDAIPECTNIEYIAENKKKNPIPIDCGGNEKKGKQNRHWQAGDFFMQSAGKYDWILVSTELIALKRKKREEFF